MRDKEAAQVLAKDAATSHLARAGTMAGRMTNRVGTALSDVWPLLGTPPKVERKEENALASPLHQPPVFYQCFPLAELPETSRQGVWKTYFLVMQNQQRLHPCS